MGKEVDALVVREWDERKECWGREGAGGGSDNTEGKPTALITTPNEVRIGRCIGVLPFDMEGPLK